MGRSTFETIQDNPALVHLDDEVKRRRVEDLLAARMGPAYEAERSRTRELLSALDDPNVADEVLAARIEADEDLRHYLHERENRPFFGAVSPNHPLPELIRILGRDKIARFVLAHAVRRAFRPNDIEARRMTRMLWRDSRRAAEFAVRLGVEVAQNQDGGVIDVRSLDVVYGRCLFAALGAVVAVAVGQIEDPIVDEDAVKDLGLGALAAIIVMSWGGSHELAFDLAAIDQPDLVEDRCIDLMVCGMALAQRASFGDSMPPSPTTLERLGFDPADWPDLLPDL